MVCVWFRLYLCCRRDADIWVPHCPWATPFLSSCLCSHHSWPEMIPWPFWVPLSPKSAQISFHTTPPLYPEVIELFNMISSSLSLPLLLCLLWEAGHSSRKGSGIGQNQTIPATHWFCGQGQVTQLLWASVSSYKCVKCIYSDHLLSTHMPSAVQRAIKTLFP